MRHIAKARFHAAAAAKKSEGISAALPVIKEAASSPAAASMSSKTSYPQLVRQAVTDVEASRPTGESGQIIRQKWPFEAMDAFLNPGQIQNRAYVLAAEPLLDLHLNEQEKQLPLAKKAGLAMERASPYLAPLYVDLQLMFEPGADIYALRERFFDKLSDAYKSDPYKEDADVRNQLQQMGRAIFSQTPLHAYGEDATRLAMELGGREPINREQPISKILEIDRKAIEKAPQKVKGGTGWAMQEKWRGHRNEDFMPTHRNNPAQNLHTTVYDNGFKTECLRFGSPTIEWKRGKPVEISPAFLLFLDSLKAEGKTLLSFQHQNPDSTAGNIFGGQESQRLDAMVALGESEEYKDVLKVVTLPMDGDFFKGKGIYKVPIQAGIFKMMLNEKLNDPEHAKLPPGHENAVKKIIDDVHQLYFNGENRALTVKERQVFQMIAYAQIEQYFIGQYRPEYYHSQCKDAMDRAMSLNVIGYYMNMVEAGKQNDPQVVQDIRTLTHMAALVLKGEGMNFGRFELLQETLDHLQNLPPEAVSAIQQADTPSGMKFKETIFARKPNQTVSPLPSGARTSVQYQERVLKEQRHSFEADRVLDMGQALEICNQVMKQRYEAPGLMKIEPVDPPSLIRDENGFYTQQHTYIIKDENDKDCYAIVADLQLNENKHLDISWKVHRQETNIEEPAGVGLSTRAEEEPIGEGWVNVETAASIGVGLSTRAEEEPIGEGWVSVDSGMAASLPEQPKQDGVNVDSGMAASLSEHTTYTTDWKKCDFAGYTFDGKQFEQDCHREKIMIEGRPIISQGRLVEDVIEDIDAAIEQSKLTDAQKAGIVANWSAFTKHEFSSLKEICVFLLHQATTVNGLKLVQDKYACEKEEKENGKTITTTIFPQVTSQTYNLSFSANKLELVVLGHLFNTHLLKSVGTFEYRTVIDFEKIEEQSEASVRSNFDFSGYRKIEF